MTMQNPVNPEGDPARSMHPDDAAFMKDSGRRIAVPVVTLWALFAEISQSLQVSSASIKAATSSLLDGTIIWDQSAQYEFVQSIDKTIDHVSSVSVAMTLAMKLAGDNLTFIVEPNSILEILSRVADALRRDTLDLSITLDLPAGGKAALVDYDYLRIALKILLESLISSSATPIERLHVRATEGSHWQIDVEGDFTGPAANLMAWLVATVPQTTLAEGVQAEAMLKAFTASHVLDQQRITLVEAHDTMSPGSFRLLIPFASE